MRRSNRTPLRGIASLAVLSMALGQGAAEEPGAARSAEKIAPGQNGVSVMELPLAECLNIALQNNHRRPASRFAVAVAEAQHRQALSGYWPHLHLKAGYQRMDQPPNFVFPASSLPAQAINVPAGRALVTVPAGVLGPTPVQLPIDIPAQTYNTAPVTVPSQDIQLMDKDSWVTGLSATWLLYDGGMRKGLREQAKGGLAAAQAEVRRTDLEISDSVRRMYYGAVLGGQLHQLGQDTLARMEATLSLTETMYKEGAGRVKKTDYLDNKVMVETLRSAVALLEKNEEMAQAALANTMGLGWDVNVKPVASEVPFEPNGEDLTELVSTAYQFSPDWAKLEAGIRALEGALRTAKSGHYPKLAVTGELHRWWNDYDLGMATDRNKRGWSVGVGIELPLFEGFLTQNKVRAARARVDQIKEQRFLLREGIGLRVRDIFLSLNAARKRYQATLDAMTTAEENRQLNTRAYQNELVETEDVIRAQMVEAFMSAQHYKMRFDHVALQARLNLVVGTEIKHRLGVKP